MTSPSATKFINVIEAMSQWPENTTVVEVAGQALSLKAARTLVKELKDAPITPKPNPTVSIAANTPPTSPFDAIGWIAAHIVNHPTSDTTSDC